MNKAAIISYVGCFIRTVYTALWGIFYPRIKPLMTAIGALYYDYKCRLCGQVYNLFTDSLWQGARYPCRKIVLLMRGVAQGVSTQHLAQELGLDRSHVLKKRHAIQQLAEERLSPLSPV